MFWKIFHQQGWLWPIFSNLRFKLDNGAEFQSMLGGLAEMSGDESASELNFNDLTNVELDSTSSFEAMAAEFDLDETQRNFLQEASFTWKYRELQNQKIDTKSTSRSKRNRAVL